MSGDRPYRAGVGAMLVNRDGHVFVAQRVDQRAEAWQMPQGGIDDGEDPDAAVLRELEEETGIPPRLVRIIARGAAPYDYDLPTDLQASLWEGRYRGQRQHWYLIAFDGEDGDIDIATEHPEFSAWRWADPAELPDIIVPFKRALYQALVAEFVPRIPAASR